MIQSSDDKDLDMKTNNTIVRQADSSDLHQKNDFQA